MALLYVKYEINKQFYSKKTKHIFRKTIDIT